MKLKALFMSGIKKSGYLQGILMKDIYKKQAEKAKDPIEFMNQFAEDVGKRCIAQQIKSVEDDILRHEELIDKNHKTMQELQFQKQQKEKEIGLKYNEELAWLKEKRHTLLQVKDEDILKISDASEYLKNILGDIQTEYRIYAEKSIDNFIKSISTLEEKYKNIFSQELSSEYQQIQRQCALKISEDFHFIFLVDWFKDLGMLLLFILTLLYDLFVTKDFVAEEVLHITSKSPDVFGISPDWQIVLVTSGFVLFAALFFHLVPFFEENNGKKKISLKGALLYLVILIVLVLWIGQSWGVPGEFVMRLFLIPVIFIGEKCLEKINWTRFLEPLKFLFWIPIQMVHYLGYAVGLAKAKLGGKNDQLDEFTSHLGSFSSLTKKIQETDPTNLSGIIALITDLKQISDKLYSTYDLEMKNYQDQVDQLRIKKEQEYIKLILPLSQKIQQIEEKDIPELEQRIIAYKRLINEKIQKVSQGVLEGLTDN